MTSRCNHRILSQTASDDEDEVLFEEQLKVNCAAACSARLFLSCKMNALHDEWTEQPS